MSTRNKTYFISDLHLGASYISDPRQHEMRVVSFLHSIAPDCRRLYLLGDVLDYWWEYRNVVPRGFTRFFGALAALADSGVEITWLKGNHDIWIFDYLPSEIGLKVHDGILVTELDGHRFLLEHGDGVGRLPWSFRRLRSLFRSRTAQRLFAAIHPRWTVGFAHSWSSHSRKQGGYVASDRAGDSLIEFAEEYSRNPSNPKVDYFIFGHCHILLRKPVGNGAEMVILGDWISRFSYAVWDGNSLSTRIYEE
ncbi:MULTISPECIES: UDP-2,3-diacylglucosamine diphosphatase [Duncaniella]|uniref:UDP-2,3-diacylglucosamine diphosphatase n=1 Tax=Duncaniella muris TaxID=2094150 RepID=A0A2V1IT97_9BACT|nr:MULTISPECIES: UDP-2,3-diacylglucosamine diphosphatase [Duncaniella]PWB04170.1 UDP-2,3-diacylglucosamine diphosphatase [Duncaniella muris]QCD38727.1 UDP-2,3-diacylglucosamine diphosphatase [Duncaniella sp. C9]QCP72414.1 UDP-2,3-diacylglucosamine diphosphatase [Duncaniella sp. B8]